MKVKKQKGIAQLKKIADKIVSEYVRRKDADFNGYNSCFTCGVKKHYKELQCGHYISRIYGHTRYYLPNLRPQCPACNIFKHGNMDEYALRLERETPGILEELNRWKKMPPTPFNWIELNKLIEDYKQKVKAL